MRVHKTEAQLYTSDMQIAYIELLQRYLEQGKYLEVLKSVYDVVKIEYSYESKVESVTVNGKKVVEPIMFARMVNGIRESAITEMIAKRLPLLQEYIIANPEALESKLMIAQLALMRNAPTLSMLLDALTRMTERITIEEVGWFKKNTVKIVDNENNKHHAADAKALQDVCHQIKRVAEALGENLGYVQVYNAPRNALGEIHNYAFDLWEGNENTPGDRLANAVRHPGCTFKDIMRNTKLGSKSNSDHVAEMLEENPELLNFILKKSGYGSLDEFMINTPEYLGKIKMLAAEFGLPGADPIEDCLLFIRILRTLDQGLKINSGSDALYKAYEKLYIACTSPKNTQTQQIQEKFNAIISSAKMLLIVHDRDFRDVIKLENGMQYIKPLIIYNGNKRKIFDQRDYEGIMNYLQAYYDNSMRLVNSDLVLEMRALVLILNFKNLKKSGHDISTKPDVLQNFVDFVGKVENIQNPRYEMRDELIRNQASENENNLRKTVRELEEMGVDVTDLRSNLEDLLQQRKQLAAQFPRETAIKAEILSIGQTAFVNFYANQVASSIRMNGEGVASMGGGVSRIAFNFDGHGGAFINVSTVQNTFLVGNDPQRGPTPMGITNDGQAYCLVAENAAEVVPSNDVLLTRFAIHLSADEQKPGYVNATLTELRVISRSEAIQHVEAKREAQKQAEETNQPASKSL